METVARKLGVSRNTVSLALRNHPSIPDSTRNRVFKTATELGYRRNPAHGELMSQMRRKGHGSTLATLALFNANTDPHAFREHPTIPAYVRGCGRRASHFDLKEAERNPGLFNAWMTREKPDVIFTLYNSVKHWVEDLGLRVPDDLGMIQLEWREEEPHWAGMNQHNSAEGPKRVRSWIETGGRV